jgi:hypothetical protein
MPLSIAPIPPMAAQLLITRHHRQALRNACERGFWMPLVLPEAQAHTVSHLTALAPGATTIAAIAPVTAMEPWSDSDGIESFLPFLGEREVLPKPIPLGHHDMLEHWLPKNRHQLQLIPLASLWAPTGLIASVSETLAATRAA